MRTAELLNAIASWLESPNNEAMLLAEHDDESFKRTAMACLEAAETLRKGASEVEAIEPHEQSNLSPEAIDHIVELATAFDLSSDAELQKTASVLDELLLTIASPPDAMEQFKNAQSKELNDLKKKYEDIKAGIVNSKVADAEEAIKDSPYYKEYHALEAPLSTRTCPDHAGAQMARIGEGTFQCSLDKKIYNYYAGYTNEKGEKVPASDVSLQSEKMDERESHSMFDNREDRLNGYLR
jgi:hypothetical protein